MVRSAHSSSALARLGYEELPPILTTEAALAQASFVLPTETMARGNATATFAGAAHRLQGTLKIGGQDHFYLEGQIALAIPQEDGGMLVYSSTRYPGEVQHKVAHALGRSFHDVTVVCRPRLNAPATPEAILVAVENLRARQPAIPAPSFVAGSLTW